ncbi:MAG: D-alanyl-D-alanine carboxypeptidase/D-alanyl-D-alanine-endopeptidase [Rhodobacteraceae bacterium]|nr:D-alanyl-D-alanine carboxypeptidase/D-alanyl-D-alanine-endopeptidase [Paracoccaceae bacterium]
MKERVSRRGVLAGLGGLTLWPGLVAAGAPNASLHPVPRPADLKVKAGGGLDGLVARFGIRGDVVCAVADVQSGLHLEALDGGRGLPPASVAKALTALYALDVLGSAYRFQTRVIVTGSIQSGVLTGDLVLKGGGDPTLDTDDLAALVAKIKAAGIREVKGDFIVDDSALPYVRSIDKEQPDHVGYSPSVSGIGLNYNRVHFQWKRGSSGYSVQMDARTEKYRPDVQMARMKVAKRRAPVYTYEDRNGVDQWSVASAALGDGGSRWLPVRKPAAYAADVFSTLARVNGVKLPKAKLRSAQGGTMIASHSSKDLQTILRGMLKYSNNLTAEMVGMTATAKRGVPFRTLKQSGQAMSDWAAQKYGMQNTRLVDHSGLGDASRMAPKDLVDALVQVRQSNALRPILKPFLMRDSKGRINKAHPIKVDAKTGTLNFVSGLGGFMTAADGTELAFAIFVADQERRSRISREERERPEGARPWNRSAKKLQQKMIERWGSLYGS